MKPALQIFALEDIPLVEPEDTLHKLLIDALEKKGLQPLSGDVLVIAQKIVSKSEGRYVYLNEVEPSAQAFELEKKTGKPAALVQVILDQTEEVLRVRGELMIVRHKLGYIHANAGVDQSNIESSPDNPRVLLLPENPQQSAVELREKLSTHYGCSVSVVINDSAGRPWRNGITGFALASAGFSAVVDKCGSADLFSRPMQVTQIAVADELASAASLVMGQADESVPAVLLRGAALEPEFENNIPLIRDYNFDLFK